MADTNIANLLNVQVSAQPSAQPALKTTGLGSSKNTAASSNAFGQTLNRVSARNDSAGQSVQDDAAASENPVKDSADSKDVQVAQRKQDIGKADAESRDAAQKDARDVAQKQAETPTPEQDAEDDSEAEKASAQTTQYVNLLFSMLTMQEQPAETLDAASVTEKDGLQENGAQAILAAAEETANPALQTLLPQSEEMLNKGQDMLKVLSGQGWQTTEARSAQSAQPAAGAVTDAEKASVQDAVLSMLTESGKSSDQAALQSLGSAAFLHARDGAGSTAQADSALSKLFHQTQQTDAEMVPADSAAASEVSTAAPAVTTNPSEASFMTSAQAADLSKVTGPVEVVSVGAPQELQQSPADPANSADAVQGSSGEDAGNVLQQAVLSLKGTQSEDDNPSTGQDQAGAQETGKAEAVTQSHSTNSSTGVSAFQQAVQASISGTQDASQTQQTTRTDYQIPQQIVDQARLIRRGEDTQMVIHLKPEHLGNLTLKVSVSADGSVNASFHSDNAQVRTIIENSLSQLRTELNNQGIKVDHVEVYAGLADGGLPQQSGQQGQQQGGGQHAMHSTQESVDTFEDEQDLQAALAQQAGEVSANGVDYRV